MKNSMTVQELHFLYTKLKNIVETAEEECLLENSYCVQEPGVLKLYDGILEGTVSRKDFLIFAIHDLLVFINENNIENSKSTLLVTYKRCYGDREF
jgi:hypothetical protein